MRPQGPRSLRLSVTFLLLNLTFLAAPRMYSQTTNNGAADIGPRFPGTMAAVTDCPVGNPVKFPPSVTSTPNCVDISQPPSTSPQPAATGAGNVVGAGPLAGMWFESINVFEAVASVQGGSVVPTEPIVGLGPAFNSNSCFSCHSAPTVGGSSPGSVTINGTVFNMPLVPAFTSNPELVAMEDQGNTFNQDPVFPTEFNPNGPGFAQVPAAGPVIEVRVIAGGGSGGFVVPPNGVAELFTIQSRTDAPGCTLAQFPFSSLGSNSISFRIPTPTFGLGLVEATPDATLVSNLAINNQTTETGSGGSTVAANAAALGIAGTFNRSGNDGTITRFGWKAQNKSLLIFAGEASNVEMGVTNELFPNEKTVAGGSTCPTNTAPAGNQPEDEILPTSFTTVPPAANVASIISSNTQNNAVFMRMNGAPSQCDAKTLLTEQPYATATGPALCPAFTTSVVTNGQTAFDSQKTTGCSLCHNPTLVSGLSQNSSLSNQTYHPYSDFAIHDMGPASNGLADGVTQGAATSEFFRTAPLWGLGQRVFFLHDGRAHDLATAIADHCPNPASPGTNESCGSIALFNGLTKSQQQNILDFLRSL
jgi:CxxC motif-containing protein (DUF1111 family)